MRLKDDSVELKALSVPMLFALVVADQVYREHGYDCVVTSANDAHHSETSLHYAGEAVDLRTRMIESEDEQKQIRDQIKGKLNIDFDVVLESDHIHLEHQPRRR